MKKIIVLFFLFLPLSLIAQRFTGGVELGLNASQIQGDLWAGYNKAGLVAGAFVFTRFDDRWGAQMEIRYAAKGSSININGPYIEKIRLQYIEIPVLGTFDLVDKIKLQAGISFGYLFSAAQNFGSGYQEFDNMPNRTELAMCGGINYELFDRLDVNARYSYSILPIWERYPGATYFEGNAWFNDVITFGIYYWIGGR